MSESAEAMAIPKWLTTFTFQREMWWLLVLYILLPLVAVLAAIVLPALLRS